MRKNMLYAHFAEICIYIVYFAINAARQNKNTNRHTDTQYTNIKLQPIQRIRTIY